MADGGEHGTGHLSGLVGAVLVLYVERALGPDGVKEVMDRVGAEPVVEVVEHWEDWVDIEQVLSLAIAVGELCHEPDIGRRTGEELFRVLQERGLLVVPPQLTVRELVPAVVASVNTAMDLRHAEVTTLEDQAAVIQVTAFEEGRTRFLCRLFTGLYALIPSLCDATGTAVERRCVNRGDKVCEFQLRWRPRPTAGSSPQLWDDRLQRLQAWADELSDADGDHASGAREAAALLAEVRRQALCDPLTGVANRTALEQRATREMERRATLDWLTLLFVDLDGFKAINDTWGHAVGDQLLVQLAARLQGAVRDHDLVARLGGDEFVVLFPEVPDDAVVERLVRKVLAVFEDPYLVGREMLWLSGSVGVSRAPHHGTTFAELLHHADHAMYRVKRARKGAIG